MIDSIYQDSKENMVKVIAALKKDSEAGSHRTGIPVAAGRDQGRLLRHPDAPSTSWPPWRCPKAA